MSLRYKTILIIGVILVLSLGLQHILINSALLQGFAALEEQGALRDIQRVVNVLDDRIKTLNTTNADWAAWDDTYQFIKDGNAHYIESNLPDSIYIELDLNLTLYVDNAGRIVYGQAFDLETEERLPVPESILEHLTTNGLLHTDVESSIAGIIMLSEGPALLSSEPILTSADEGPVRGALIMMRYLDANMVDALVEMTQLSFTLSRLDDAQTSKEFETVIASLSPETPVLIAPLNEDTVVGYTWIDDIYGNHTLLLSVNVPREIYQQGQTILRFLIVSTAITAMVFMLAVLLTLERTVLFRLTKLSRSVNRIRSTGDLSVSLPIEGKDEMAALANDFQEMLATIDQYQQELRGLNKELEQRVAMRTAELVETIGFLETEVTERRRVQDELAQARDQALEALQLKTRILANISHDARTPLNVIMLNIQLLQHRGDLTDEQQKRFRNVLVAVGQLQGFFDNLIEEALNATGKMKLSNTVFTPSSLLDKIVDNMQPLALQKGLELHAELDKKMPATLYSDPQRLGQILSNLLGNALKFTTQGMVKVRLYLSDATHWAIEVSDTGHGIAPNALKYIFEPFWQADGSVTREANRGVGLGLSIVKQLVTLMGGTIDVQSEVEVGTTFTVVLPLAVKETEVAQ